MPWYVARNYLNRVEAVQFTNAESLKAINKLLEGFPHYTEPCVKGFYLKTESENILVTPGQYVVTTWVAVVVKDAPVFEERFKPMIKQQELFR